MAKHFKQTLPFNNCDGTSVEQSPLISEQFTHGFLMCIQKPSIKKKLGGEVGNLPKIFFQVDLECLSFPEKQQRLESFL